MKRNRLVRALGMLALALPNHAGAQNPPPPAAAPEFKEAAAWINSKPLKLADQKGKVVVVHFWTHTCSNCIANYPHYRAWAEKFKAEPYLMVGIHTPEFASDKIVASIKAAAERKKLKFPILVDNDHANWQAWKNRYWPAVYLVDKAGKVRKKWEGELGAEGFEELTADLETLLAEPAPAAPAKKK